MPATPLTDRGGERTVNTSTSYSVSSPDSDIVYPSTALALHELNDLMPDSDALQYVARFRDLALYRLDLACAVDDDYLREHVGMDNDMISAFREHAEKLVTRARKGKGKAKQVKVEEDDEDKENKPIIID